MKGHFTQGVCVLFEGPISVDEIEAGLGAFEIAKRREASEYWEFSGPGLILAFRPEVNGYVAVDVVDRKWPDRMGDPKNESAIFGAWAMGHFGPFTYPGNLARAGQQCWGWEPGRKIAERHHAFVRTRSSYVFGAAGDHPVIPVDYNPAEELRFVTDVALALLAVPGALCYFNPNGEVLRDADTIQRMVESARSHDVLPLDAWSNVRLFRAGEGWNMMDTVGMWQLDVPDHEAIFASERYDCGQVDAFLRNTATYAIENGDVIKNGDTTDGPGDLRWRAKKFNKGLCDPPREVLRWIPIDGQTVPGKFLEERED